MKRFLIRCCVFTLCLLLVATLCDLWISSKGRASGMRNQKLWNEWYGKNDSYDVIISGNSRAMVQYDPTIMDSLLHVDCFNLGFNGSSINRQVIKYKIYRRTHPAPKLIVQNVDFYTLAITKGYRVDQFYPYWNDKELVRMFDEYENFTWTEKWIPCFRYIGYPKFVRQIVRGEDEDKVLYKGYRPYEQEWDAKNLEDAIEEGGHEYDRDPLAIQLLYSFIQEVRKDGSEIILVHAPMYSKTYNGLIIEPEKMFALYDSIAAVSGIRVLDYTNMPFSNDTTYFYNGTHMNKKGAEIFTRQLAQDIDSLGLLK